MEKGSKSDRIAAIEHRLDSMMQRLAKLERKLEMLERTGKAGAVKHEDWARSTGLGSRSSTYIKRVIDSVRREYDREF